MFISTMNGLYMLFDHSSIHGLPYLTPKHHGPFGRLLWLLCVLASFTLAGLVIWKNVESWQSQPAVVSSVEYALVEDQAWLPQVVVCPTSLNSMAMFHGLVQATHEELFTPDRLIMIKAAIAKMKIMDDYYWSSRADFGQTDILRIDPTPYENCFALKDKLSDSCSLILVLTVMIDKFGFQKAQEEIVTYAAIMATNSSTPDLINYMSDINGISSLDIKSANSTSLMEYYGVLYLYNTFFDVIKETHSELLEPQTLNTYITKMPKIEITDKSQIGLHLTWILNAFSLAQYKEILIKNDYHYSAMNELFNAVASTWIDALKIYLDVGSDQEATLLINSFWHGGLESAIFQPSKERREKGYMCNLYQNSTINNLDSVCVKPEKIGIECIQYCHTLNNLKSHTKTRIAEVLKMGLDAHTPTVGAFQSCKHPAHGFFNARQCWKTVVNDKGVCYSSKGNGALTNIVPGETKHNPFLFLFDGGQNIELLEAVQNSYTLRTLSSSTNKRKVDVHVVPYHQDAVEDILWEQEEEDINRLLFTLSNDPQKRFYNNDYLVQQATAHIEYVQNSTRTFKAMKPYQKNCYLPQNEKTLKHFDKYSEADCMLECTWEMAKDNCRCVPWYLVDMYPDQHMCEIVGNRCFEKIVASRYKKNSLAKEQCQSNCLLDCDTIKYSTKRTWLRRQVSEDLVKDYFAQKSDDVPSEVLKLANNITRFLTKGNIFEIELRLLNNKLAQKIVRTATMTTTDLISNMGGTLGLFCGLSVLSLVEILYWTGTALWSFIAKKITGMNKQI